MLRFKTEEAGKVQLKLTPRQVIFRTKQVQQYREYLRKTGSFAARRAGVNHVEDCSHDISICPIEEECASYVGPELTKLAAISALEESHIEEEGEASLESAHDADVSHAD